MNVVMDEIVLLFLVQNYLLTNLNMETKRKKIFCRIIFVLKKLPIATREII